ncbi:MAG TPA: acyl-CoA thioesterase [Ignavibacteria bacterium]|nr:acyl-CoA thioesterase [Ignavibacteria bacterium]
MNNKYSIFETELTIRPDDIDMNNHVHNSKYLDYVLAARYDQMRKDYKVTMEDFLERGFTWVVSQVNINYKRALILTDKIIVRTQVDDFNRSQSIVNFEIVKKENGKVAADGQFIYTMINVETGRPAKIPEDFIAKYTI